MSTMPRAQRLIRLQDSLMARGEPGVREAMLLPFVVGAKVLAFPYAEVARVTLPSAIVRLPPTPHVPAFVAGAAASESEMLTVIDAGVLLGGAPIQQSMKTRLIVMGEGPMKGFGLLVTRVLDMASAEALRSDPSTQITCAADLATQINSQAPAYSEPQQ